MRWEYKFKSKEVWHKWFAWYPVTLLNTHTKVWLEFVLRRSFINDTCTHYYYEYTIIPFIEILGTSEQIRGK
jgi:hypothetical protein